MLELLASNATINQSDSKHGAGKGPVVAALARGLRCHLAEAGGPRLEHTRQGQLPGHPGVVERRRRVLRVGGERPTELEWETAARGGLEDEPFPWGMPTMTFTKE